MEEAVAAFISKENLIKRGSRVCAAVSGGADSIALLHCLYRMQSKFGFTLNALHFEHGIRGAASIEDADFVKSECRELGVELFLRSGDVPASAKTWGVGIETAAKRCREAFFEEITAIGYADLIATAHHADDNTESVFMHLIRGCGTAGLIGVRAKKGNVIRPLLCVNKEQILAYAHGNGIRYSEDATNFICDNVRNILRNKILPSISFHINPRLSQAAARLSKAAADDEAFIIGHAADAYEKAATKRSGETALNIEQLKKLHPAVLNRVIRLALGETCGLSDIQTAHIDAVLSLLEGSTGKSVSLIKSFKAKKVYNDLIISRETKAITSQFPTDAIKIRDLCGETALSDGWILKGELKTSFDKRESKPYSQYFDLNSLNGRAVIRTRHPGDRIRPLGAPGTKKLKDYFIDKKVPAAYRNTAPLLADGNNILWAIGYTISDDCRVTENTVDILKLSYIKKGSGS